jgi:hypothetical protein
MIETLESRTLYSADVGHIAGLTYVRTGDTLLVQGTPGDDTVILQPAPAGAAGPLRVRGITLGPGGTPTEATHDFAGVKSVLIDTGAGRDAVFKFEGVGASFVVWLGDGDDVAYDQADPDTGLDVIIGGPGNDEIFDFVGDDVLIGGPGGSDFIYQP